MQYKITDLINLKIRLVLGIISLFSLLFLQTYCTNICPFIDGLQPDQLLRNLGFVFILHLLYRELLYFGFRDPWKNFSLPRQAYFLSMLSWILAGISAFVLHFILYPDFPMGSHLKLFSAYIILGGGILSQIEYILFEASYKKIAIEKNILFLMKNSPSGSLKHF
jgi:hypothetical protein